MCHRQPRRLPDHTPATCSWLPACSNALPHLLRREVVIQAQEIAEITGAAPGVAVPVVAEHLEAGTPITTRVMLFERAGADTATIARYVPTNRPRVHLCDIPLFYDIVQEMNCGRVQVQYQDLT